jgi:hypothetical protein
VELVITTSIPRLTSFTVPRPLLDGAPPSRFLKERLVPPVRKVPPGQPEPPALKEFKVFQGPSALRAIKEIPEIAASKVMSEQPEQPDLSARKVLRVFRALKGTRA